jgi:cytochrome c-type biogenesis protein CcmH
MTVFWIVAALAAALVLALLMRPFYWKRTVSSVSHRDLNAAIFRDQLVKLETDRTDQLIAQADYEQALAELNRRVIEEASQEDPTLSVRAPKRTLLAIGFALPLAATLLYVLLGNPAALNPPAVQAAVGQQEIERMVESLAMKLEADPNNPKGWVMLARSYMVMGRPLEAEQAFVKAGPVVETDAQLLAMYADIAASNAGGNFSGKPMQLIDKALKLDPNHVMALWLAGSAAFQAQNFNSAIRFWGKIIPQLQPDSDDARGLQEAIREAYDKQGKPMPVAKAASLPKSNSVAAPAASVVGVVELDASLKSKASPDDVVMVIARVPGSRMPVAVLRKHASDLPLQFVLDDSLAMSPQAKLSMASEVNVEARISKSGMAQPEPGDLISEVQTVKVGSKGLKIRVAKVRP